MPDLIPFATRQWGSQSVHTVNARDLYAYLEINKDYTSWIKAQLKRTHLVENRDYVVFTLVGENPKGGRPHVEHHLTFDAAKHVAMVSSAEKGHTVRQWFIEKEKELARLATHPMAIDRFPELRAIVELAESTAAARILAEEAKFEAAQATANAARALDSQLFFTVAEYVYINQLQRQVPETTYKTCSDHLRLYCLDHNIPFRKIPIGGKRWEEEYGFHVSVFTDAFTRWLTRRHSQATLQVLPATKGASHG